MSPGAALRAAGIALWLLGVSTLSADDGPRERLFVGVQLQGDEVGSLQLLSDGTDYLIPLEPLSRLVGFDVVGDGSAVTTPLGNTRLDPADRVLVDGVTFVRRAALEQRLGARLSFDSAEWALRVDVPWRGLGQTGGSRPAEPLRPDVAAPRLSLSTLRQDLRYSRVGDASGTLGTTTLGGTLEGGTWRVRMEDDLEGGRRMRDYAWSRTFGSRLLLAGQQSVQLHPQLGGFQLTGVQAAWTNRPLTLFPRSSESRELLPRRVRAVDTFRGSAPPGSLVRLYVDDIAAGERIAGLDGSYEFLDVPLPARRLSQVEVRIFDRHNPAVPLEIRETSTGASEYLLPAGAAVHLGGLGRGGNAADEWLGTDDAGGLAAFYQWRQGLAAGFTTEASIQHAAGKTEAAAGFVASLAPGWIATLGLTSADGRAGYGVELDGSGRRWRGLVSTRLAPAEALDGRNPMEHSLEGWYSATPRLELGLAARDRVSGRDRLRYVMPLLAWRPTAGLALHLRPGVAGDPRLYATWRPTARDRLVLVADERRAFDYSHVFGSAGLRLSLSAEAGAGERRQSVVVGRHGAGLRRTGWNVGVVGRAGDAGLLAAATLPVLPGVLARVDYETYPSASSAPGREDRLTAGLVIDLTLAGRRLAAADTTFVEHGTGAVAGRVRVDTEPGNRRGLGGLTVRVDDRPAAVTDARGAFWVANLPPGTHRIELDRERLPLEFVPARAAMLVEVAPGASTRTDFILRIEYGIAGRVVDAAEQPVGGLRVELIDSDGTPIAGGRTDRFGLYRMDGVPPGRYRLRVAPGEHSRAAEASPEATVVVTDGFLFGQDLQLPRSLLADPPPTDALTTAL